MYKNTCRLMCIYVCVHLIKIVVAITMIFILFCIVKTQKETITVNDEIDLDDMEYNEELASYSLKCRCSGIYYITEEELEDGIDIIGCDNCSLKIRVIYDVVDDDDDDDM
ncbi:unnamed protein product [Cunninghamella echinulata]